MIFVAAVAVFAFGFLLFFGVRATPAGLRGRPIISCYTVVLGLFGVYFFLPAALLVVLKGGEYVWLPRYGGLTAVAATTSLCIMAALLFIAGYAFRSRGGSARPRIALPTRQRRPAEHLAWLLVAAGIAIKLYVIMTSGGVESTLARMSTGVRIALDIEPIDSSLVALRFASGIADGAISWLLVHRLHHRRRWRLVALVFTLVLALSFFGTGKRLYILWPLVVAALGVHFYVKPLRVTLLPAAILLVLAAGFGSLMFRIYAPASVASAGIDLTEIPWAEGSLIRFYFFSLEFASFELFSLAIYNPELITNQFGGALSAFYTTNIESFSYFVPRAIWPGKPPLILDVAHANWVVVLGGSIREVGGLNSMLPGTSWALGGPLALLVTMLGLGWLSAAADGRSEIRGIPTPRTLLIYAFEIVLVFHLFRQGTLGWTAIIVVLQQLGMFLAVIMLISTEGVSLTRPVAPPSRLRRRRPLAMPARPRA